MKFCITVIIGASRFQELSTLKRRKRHGENQRSVLLIFLIAGHTSLLSTHPLLVSDSIIAIETVDLSYTVLHCSSSDTNVKLKVTIILLITSVIVSDAPFSSCGD